MSSQSKNKPAISPQEMYKNIIKRVNTTESTLKSKLKHDILNRYSKHMSMIESHQQRQSRFEKSFENLARKEEQRKQKLKVFLKEKEEKTQNSRTSYLNQKRKKMTDSMKQWEYTVSKNTEDHNQHLKESSHLIEEWNKKCEASIKAKKERLDTISSRISERSRICASKAHEYQQSELKRLQKRVPNPEGFDRNKLNYSASKVHVISKTIPVTLKRSVSKQSVRLNTSRLSSTSQTVKNHQAEEEKMEKYLEKLLTKERKITEARKKKNELIKKNKEEANNKDLYFDELHRQNKNSLNEKKQQMDNKLDRKYFQDRKNNKKYNHSLPAINALNRQMTSQGHQKNQGFPNKRHERDFISPKSDQKAYLKQQKNREKKFFARTISPTYDKLIIEQLRNVSILNKMHREKANQNK